MGEAGLLTSALALGAMALGNGIELYTVMTRGTESEVGHTIFLIAFLALIAASVLVGQVFVRRRWSAGVRWGGLLLLLALPLGVLLLIVGGALSPDTDLGFWSALTVPYALARVLLAVFAPPGAMPSANVDDFVIKKHQWGSRATGGRHLATVRVRGTCTPRSHR